MVSTRNALHDDPYPDEAKCRKNNPTKHEERYVFTSLETRLAEGVKQPYPKNKIRIAPMPRATAERREDKSVFRIVPGSSG